MEYQFYTADVFTNEIFGGNPLAVFPLAEGLTPQMMQRIAQEFNLSETVFVLPPTDPAHAYRLRIFTPEAELPFAGHPTVGAAFILAKLGQIPLTGDRTNLIFEEGVGPVPVTVFARGGQPTGAQLTAAIPPQFGPPAPGVEILAQMLGLELGDILTGTYAPATVSCGLPFLFVPVRDRQALKRAKINPRVWEEHVAGSWAPMVFVLTFDPERPGSDLRGRMFAPSLSIVEDPATGSAAAALGGYLGVRAEPATGTLRWVVEQGFEMGRPSLLTVEADKRDGVVHVVRVAGDAVLVSRGDFTVPK